MTRERHQGEDQRGRRARHREKQRQMKPKAREHAAQRVANAGTQAHTAVKQPNPCCTAAALPSMGLRAATLPRLGLFGLPRLGGQRLTRNTDTLMADGQEDPADAHDGEGHGRYGPEQRKERDKGHQHARRACHNRRLPASIVGVATEHSCSDEATRMSEAAQHAVSRGTDASCDKWHDGRTGARPGQPREQHDRVGRRDHPHRANHVGIPLRNQSPKLLIQRNFINLGSINGKSARSSSWLTHLR